MEETDRTGVLQEQHFSLREAARILEVPESRLKVLARAGLVSGPADPPSFGFQDLLRLRTTRELLDSGVPMRKVRRIWTTLRDQVSPDLPLTSISISTEGESVVASDGQSRWRPESGQMLLDLGTVETESHAADAASEPPARLTLVEAPAPIEPRAIRPHPAHDAGAHVARAHPADDASFTAEDWYEIGCEQESVSSEQALRAYERSIALDPDRAEAHLNLGRLLHLAGERGRAEPHYREAVRLDPEDPTPHFNLGVLLDEAGRRDEAVLAYLQAIRRDPDFADAYCNLGLLLESLGRRQEAMRHLMTARQLAEGEG